MNSVLLLIVKNIGTYYVIMTHSTHQTVFPAQIIALVDRLYTMLND